MGAPNMDALSALRLAVIDGDDVRAAEFTKQALDGGVKPSAIVTETLSSAMTEIAKQYEAREVALPELILAADAFHASLGIAAPLMKKDASEPLARVVIGTVQYDIHELGHQLVKAMLEAAGFECYSVGKDVPASEFVKKAVEVKADIVGASALMTTTMPGQREVIEALVEAGIRDQVKVMVGGAPVSNEWAKHIGADGYAKDAVEAVGVAKRLIGKS